MIGGQLGIILAEKFTQTFKRDIFAGIVIEGIVDSTIGLKRRAKHRVMT